MNNKKEIFGLHRITKVHLKQLCKKHRLYQTPHLNDQLYLHYQGFQAIENLEEYTGLKCLWLESNAISEIEGLECQKELKCLFLQNNLIRKIENLEGCSELDTLNLASNHISMIENCGIDVLPVLSTLNLSRNYIRCYDGLKELVNCRSLWSLDLSHNRIDDILVVKIFASMPELRVLVLQGNPVVNKVPQYRKTLILECKNLTYLDSRPVFPKDRACAEAWKRGGYEEERKEHERWIREERRKIRDSVNATLRLRIRNGDKEVQLITTSDEEEDEKKGEVSRDLEITGVKSSIDVQDDQKSLKEEKLSAKNTESSASFLDVSFASAGDVISSQSGGRDILDTQKSNQRVVEEKLVEDEEQVENQETVDNEELVEKEETVENKEQVENEELVEKEEPVDNEELVANKEQMENEENEEVVLVVPEEPMEVTEVPNVEESPSPIGQDKVTEEMLKEDKLVAHRSPSILMKTTSVFSKSPTANFNAEVSTSSSSEESSSSSTESFSDSEYEEEDHDKNPTDVKNPETREHPMLTQMQSDSKEETENLSPIESEFQKSEEENEPQKLNKSTDSMNFDELAESQGTSYNETLTEKRSMQTICDAIKRNKVAAAGTPDLSDEDDSGLANSFQTASSFSQTDNDDDTTLIHDTPRNLEEVPPERSSLDDITNDTLPHENLDAEEVSVDPDDIKMPDNFEVRSWLKTFLAGLKAEQERDASDSSSLTESSLGESSDDDSEDTESVNSLTDVLAGRSSDQEMMNSDGERQTSGKEDSMLDSEKKERNLNESGAVSLEKIIEEISLREEETTQSQTRGEDDDLSTTLASEKSDTCPKDPKQDEVRERRETNELLADVGDEISSVDETRNMSPDKTRVETTQASTSSNQSDEDEDFEEVTQIIAESTGSQTEAGDLPYNILDKTLTEIDTTTFRMKQESPLVSSRVEDLEENTQDIEGSGGSGVLHQVLAKTRTEIEPTSFRMKQGSPLISSTVESSRGGKTSGKEDSLLDSEKKERNLNKRGAVSLEKIAEEISLSEEETTQSQTGDEADDLSTTLVSDKSDSCPKDPKQDEVRERRQPNELLTEVEDDISSVDETRNMSPETTKVEAMSWWERTLATAQASTSSNQADENEDFEEITPTITESIGDQTEAADLLRSILSETQTEIDGTSLQTQQKSPLTLPRKNQTIQDSTSSKESTPQYQTEITDLVDTHLKINETGFQTAQEIPLTAVGDALSTHSSVDDDNDDDDEYDELPSPSLTTATPTLREVLDSFNKAVEVINRRRQEKLEKINDYVNHPLTKEQTLESEEQLNQQIEQIKQEKQERVRHLVEHVYAQREKYDDTLEVIDGRLMIVKRVTGALEEVQPPPSLKFSKDSLGGAEVQASPQYFSRGVSTNSVLGEVVPTWNQGVRATPQGGAPVSTTKSSLSDSEDSDDYGTPPSGSDDEEVEQHNSDTKIRKITYPSKAKGIDSSEARTSRYNDVEVEFEKEQEESQRRVVQLHIDAEVSEWTDEGVHIPPVVGPVVNRRMGREEIALLKQVRAGRVAENACAGEDALGDVARMFADND